MCPPSLTVADLFQTFRVVKFPKDTLAALSKEYPDQFPFSFSVMLNSTVELVWLLLFVGDQVVISGGVVSPDVVSIVNHNVD